ncbi:probable membrane-associated kinase regulator 4 [Camellia sinensis]|uniref:Membrane-associated kinase regulator 4 n=1 Tax=Camellia sinensis var. sinensis TaxID=542762 RepID=A0A4V3WK65_CAMSN|nr:probable membrane-associated kinase regulator 4 [Camellia sinensis]THF99636.1 hypothetical protein TEA_009948 [Camellia sinensis var. sinensis]
MATTSADEDYIDMEVSSSSSTFFCYSMNSPPPQTREFEFQMSSIPNNKPLTTSPADELFYKGKLLPLHLPPRLQMVQNLLQTTTTTTPLNQSCNISPSESCRVSCELNSDEHFFEWSTELSGFLSDHHLPKKSWSKKLKLIKQSSLSQKLKATRAYLKSLFSKSACSDESSAKAECMKQCMKVENKSPFGQIGKGAYPTIASVMKSIDREMSDQEGVNGHRKSFSGAIKRHSAIKSSSSSSSSSSGASSLSSSFSINSSGFYELQFFKRSISANSEIESSIEGAIAHCKQSQQEVFGSSKMSSEVGLCSVSASRIAVSEDKER